MKWRCAGVAGLVTAVALSAVPAWASVVAVDGDMVAFADVDGEPNTMRVNWGNNPTARPALHDDADVTQVDGECELLGDYVYCSTPGTPRFGLLLGDGDDYGASINSQSLGTTTRIFGQDGDDTLESYEGSDVLSGGRGRDILVPDRDHPHGGDVLGGGPGRDLLQLGGVVASRIRASLDGKADDGTPGDRDNYRADIEDVNGSALARNVIIGNRGANDLRGGDRADRLVGKGGRDRLTGLDGADTLDARDGRGGDRVDCGAGADKALVDRGDIVTRRSCERIVRR
ncbi:hypothetical protein [Nocardioides sp. YIM 152315]|uniref:hypothetical protein n=1 Tax=Nocardioides sp. YIM 152315 TaxID=3031760 RepID=UPI0023DB2BC1|nr:hypothetical protein [Nocardioides sp. YIM 152315]MDF1606410.1 hypothetical protein [Nocardioides sp. YIM 152315]